MDNLGYKEGSTKPKPKPLLHRRVSRAVSLQVENEAVPLSLTSRFKTVPPNIRWRPEPNTVIDETLPGNNFHFMEMGPSPPAEGIPSIYDSFEEPSSDISVHVGSDTIRNSIGEQMKLVAGRAKLLEDIEQGNVILENVTETFEDATKSEKNLCLLWCAFLKRWDLLEPLIEAGADPLFVDNSGMTALHLSAFSGCLTSTSFFISKELDVNSQAKYFSPLHMAAFGNSPETARLLINNGAKLDTFSGKPNCEESLLHVAVRANALECVRLFISEGMDVNSLKPNGTNAIHLAADLGASDCLRVLLECKTADPNIKICVREKESTALHLAADEGNVECVNLLLNRGANAKLKNHRGFTALHLAARTSSLECVESLLRNGGADPNAEDFEQRTPLHAAVGKSESAFDILETLIQWGAEVNKKDKYGFSALHLAALENLSQCVELLIFHGADVTTKSKKGTSALNVITRKTPASLAMVRQKLDAAITMTHSQEAANREVELQLDFRTILQYCHPREISFLNTFVDEGQKEILQHPLCSAFLYIKWGKIRKYYIARLLFCFTFVLFLTLYVLTALAHNCYNGSKDMEETIQEQELCQKQSILGDMLRNNPFVMEMQWWVLVAITIVEICRKIYGITGYSSFRHYVTQVENIIEWFVIVSVFVISYIYTNRTYTWQNHIGAFAVLLGWINLMLMIGQLPVLGAYVAMYTKVQGEFAKLFMAYSCMLVGFTISFCVIFPSSSSFANPFMGFITVLVMMTGEQDLELLINDPDGKDPPFLLEISAQITFVLFLLFVTVILMNLLVGIAVHDIQGLKKTAGLSKLVRQTKLISYIESALFNGWLPDWLRSLLHYTALVSPTAYRVVLSVKPLNPGEKRLPRDILMAAYEVAKHHKLTGRTVSPKNNPPSSTFTNYFSYKTKYESNHFNNNVLPNGGLINTGSSTGNFDLHSHRSSNHYDIGYNGLHHDDDGTDSIVCSLTTKIDENAEKIDKLANEIRELKSALSQNHLVIEQLLTIISNQHKNSFKQ